MRRPSRLPGRAPGRGAATPSAGQKQPVDTAKIVDAIKIDEVHWNADYKSGDPGLRVASHFAPDAVAMYSGLTSRRGRRGDQGGLNEQAFNDNKYAVSFESDRVDVADSGDLAVSHGAYKQTTTDPKTGKPVTATGSYVIHCL